MTNNVERTFVEKVALRVDQVIAEHTVRQRIDNFATVVVEFESTAVGTDRSERAFVDVMLVEVVLVRGANFAVPRM